MAAHPSARFFFLLLAAALFALHFQLMPRVGHAAENQTVSATAVVHLHSGDCDGGCCRETACCVQAPLFPETVISPPPSARYGVATQAAFPLPVTKPLNPPPKVAVA